MTRLVDELKVRARLRVNAARRDGDAPALRLKDTLHAAAREVGFLHWEHGRRVLGGLATAGDDMGGFWHSPDCTGLLSQWFASHAAARAALAQAPGHRLLPYRRQCVLVQPEFVAVLGLDPQDPAWDAAGHDLVAAYGQPAWLHLAWQRLTAAGQRCGG